MASINSDQSHVQVYSGAFVPLADYKKFDIVSAASGIDGVFYYAKEDIVKGGGASISGPNRFIFDGAQNTITDTNLNPLTDEGRFIDEGFKVGQLIEIAGASNPRNNKTFIIKTVTASVIDTLRIWTRNLRDETNVNSEGKATNDITIRALDQTPGESTNQLWSQNDFFFDPDYGSSVDFTTSTRRFEFGDGYYSVQPKGVNCINAKFHLKFDNRTTREANSIVHFLENKLGQHEIDQDVDYLPYKQGISGFHWDGASMFFPYNSTENLTKSFYCRSWDHSLTSEDSNKVTCTFENFDTSILRKSEQIWTERVDSWNKDVTYYKNDIVFVSGNHQYYYHSGEYTSPGTQFHPTGWDGVPADSKNTPWTREFYWPPALGLQIKEEPRLRELSMGYNNYKQIHADGINQSLLKLELNFEGRDDNEAKAILHFLETHYGSKSFSLTLPAPYNAKRRFICPSWNHTYVFKNTHNVRCEIEEFPFNFSDEEFDQVVSDTELRGGEINAPGFITMGKVNPIGDIAWNDNIERGEKRRRRIEVHNLGDVGVTGLKIEGPYPYNPDDNFEGTRVNLVGDEASRNALGDFDNNLWEFTPLTDKSKGVVNIEDDYGRTKIPPSISHGPKGGLYFFTIDDQGAVQNGFFQNNQGSIHSLDGADFHPQSLIDGGQVIKNSKNENTKFTYPTEYKNWRILHDNEKGSTMIALNNKDNLDTTLTRFNATSLLPAESCFFELVFNPNLQVLDEDKVYAAQFKVSASGDPPPGSELPPVKQFAKILVIAFSGTKWRADQLNQSSKMYPKGKLKASHVSVIDETQNTDPYVYYDGCFDGQLKLTVDYNSLVEQDLGDGLTAKMWGISRNGGTSWKMFNDTVGDPLTFEWKGIEAGIQRLAIADLVSEEMIVAEAAVGLLPKVRRIGIRNGRFTSWWEHPGKGQRRTLTLDWKSKRIYDQ